MNNLNSAQPIIILMADDDADDRLMAAEAFEESHVANDLHFVEDGSELIDYLEKKGRYADSNLFPTPDLILLDLNMPRKDGREALQEIKAQPHLRRIPVVILTTSQAEEDILRSYDIGAAGYITKPVSFDRLVDIITKLGEYWVQIVKLPPKNTH